MTCYHPLNASRNVDSHNIVKINFDSSKFALGSPLKLPCGRCVGCRLERSRQWAIRCVHEASLHSSNCFITLTFSDEYLATRSNKWSLDYRDWQLFMKRLRRKVGQVRFYHCGEYGEMCKACDKSVYICSRSECKLSVTNPDEYKVLGRPHYHACLFGYDFPDKSLLTVTSTGHRLYRSKLLEDIWTDPKSGMQMGFVTIGDVTFESAAYVARYIMKKITGDQEKIDEHYYRHDTGERLKPEYTTMSRCPGIARDFIDTYVDDIYPHDFVVINGKKCRPPRYYDKVLKMSQPFLFDEIHYNRAVNAEKYIDNNTPERLIVREAVQLDSLKLLPRNKDF